ncbi:cytochrome c family protein [Phenylobacterium sp. J367]|uniref:c-type cytochrome n=1 Tax=Phenylobacterium sp. J367 TaxID=2898435 RepID=UPI0021512429|nr:c-type cytochrome [Phenylobacterium sp. J367]MCR5877809.1 c-type cytochrome [Phenylobacterium sp. J367]
MLRSLLAVAALSLAASPALAADGAQLFNMQCKMCHAGGPMGPSLNGVAGAKIAAKPGFAYSPALKGKDGTWTDANLDAFLKAPTQFAPGTRMMIAVPSDANRAAVIAYLKTLK